MNIQLVNKLTAFRCSLLLVVAFCASTIGQQVVEQRHSGLVELFEECEALLSDTAAQLAKDPARSEETPSTVDSALLLYCEKGRLVSRGVTHNIAAGPIDAWLVRDAFHNKEFAAALEITEKQRAAAKVEDGRYLASASPEDIVDKAIYRLESGPGWGYYYWLEEHLTSQQQAKLPYLYLQLEGLMALRRSSFRELIGISLEEQRAIVDVINDFDRRYPHARGPAGWGLDENELFLVPRGEAISRMISANVDLTILRTLDKLQREKLHGVLQDIATYEHLRGPGALPDKRYLRPFMQQ